MKVVTIVAAAALLCGVNAASAQTYLQSAGKPDATINMEKKGSAARSKAHQTRRTLPPQERSTTGSGSFEDRGVTPGSNPNPSWNTNPDPEVPGNTEE